MGDAERYMRMGLNAARNAGRFDARKPGASENDNPYRPREHRAAWLEGFRFGLSEIKDQSK